MLELSKLLSTISYQWGSCTQRPKASLSWGVSRNRLFSKPKKKKKQKPSNHSNNHACANVITGLGGSVRERQRGV